MQIRIHSELKYSHLNSFIRIQIQYFVYKSVKLTLPD